MTYHWCQVCRKTLEPLAGGGYGLSPEGTHTTDQSGVTTPHWHWCPTLKRKRVPVKLNRKAFLAHVEYVIKQRQRVADDEYETAMKEYDAGANQRAHQHRELAGVLRDFATLLEQQPTTTYDSWRRLVRERGLVPDSRWSSDYELSQLMPRFGSSRPLKRTVNVDDLVALKQFLELSSEDEVSTSGLERMGFTRVQRLFLEAAKAEANRLAGDDAARSGAE